MNEGKAYATILLTVMIAPAIGFASFSHFSPSPVEDVGQPEATTSQNTELTANVYAYKNGELVGENHNVLMDGEAVVTNLLTSGDTYEYETIAVGNGTAPVDSDTQLDGRITSDGFAPTAGTVDVQADGESYNITHTFTATGSVDVNTTALEINSNYGTAQGVNGNSVDVLAGTDFGRTIPFEDDDQLTVEYQVITDDPQ